jgi:phosphoenolpyruvate carboxykinase (GTP)
MYVVPYLMAVPGSPLSPHALGVELTDERTIIHFGSAFGGNAVLGKIAHGLRLASYDGWRSGEFLTEQFMLLGIEDTVTGKTRHVVGGFPSASGKTNLAIEAIRPGTGTIFTNVAYNELTEEVWWEGRTPAPPADVTGWRDWTGELIAERPADRKDAPWAHPNSRFTTTLANVTSLAPDSGDAAGVPVDLVIFGGRTRDREPLTRVVDGSAAGVYDGLPLGAEATFAAEGVDGRLRYDPMSMRPFLSYPEGRYAQHWLDVLGRVTEPPTFAHVNWFQREPETGRYLWPGFRENLRVLLWLLAYREGSVSGTQTPVGVVPTAGELDLTGLDIPDADLATLLSINPERWEAEMRSRTAHLDAFSGLPDEVWQGPP